MHPRRLLGAIAARAPHLAKTSKELGRSGVPRGIEANLCAQSPSLSVGTDERNLNRGSPRRPVQEYGIRPLLARDDQIERSIVRQIREDARPGIVSNAHDHSREECEGSGSIVHEDAFHRVAGLTGDVQVEISVVVDVAESSRVLHTGELLNEAKVIVLVPEQHRAMVAGDEAVEVSVIVDVGEAEPVRAAVVLAGPWVVKVELLRALAESLLSLVQENGDGAGCVALVILE